MPRDVDTYIDGLTRRKSGAGFYSRRKQRKITDLTELTQPELQFAIDYAAVLKGAAFSWKYISDTLGIQTSLVKSFADTEGWDEKVAMVVADRTKGAIDHLRNASIDLMEALLEIARHEPDAKIRLQAIIEGLDRVGITKVNKSESKLTKEETITPGDDFFEKMAALPLETQKEIATLMAQAEELVTAAKGTE